jgi:hypothetical protein
VGRRNVKSPTLCGQVNKAAQLGQKLGSVPHQAGIGFGKLATLFGVQPLFQGGQLTAPLEHLKVLNSADAWILSIYHIGLK